MGRRLGWEAGTNRSEDPREPWLWARLQGKAEGTENTWGGGGTGKPQRGEGMSFQTERRTEDQRRDRERKAQEDVAFLFGLANIVCALGQAQC